MPGRFVCGDVDDATFFRTWHDLRRQPHDALIVHEAGLVGEVPLESHVAGRLLACVVHAGGDLRGIEVVHRADVLAPQVHLESLGPVPLGRVAFASSGCLLQCLVLSLSWADWVTYARRAYRVVTRAKTARMTVAAAVTHVAASSDMGES